MATYRKRGKSVQVQVRMMGVEDTASFPSVAMAKEWARDREAEIVAGARGLIVTGKTIAMMFDKYIEDVAPKRKASREETLRLTAWKRDWAAAHKPIDKVSSDDIAQFRDWRESKVTGESVRREMTLLSTVFEIARTEWKWVRVNPVRGVKKPKGSKHRTRLVTPGEYKALLRASGYRPGRRPKNKTQLVFAAWCLALRTAARAGELVNLQWRHVDLKKRTAHLLDTKNGTDRTIPLFPRAIRIISTLRPHDVSLAGERVFADINSETLDALFRKVRDRIAIEDLHFHDSRHTATTMFARFLDVLELARVTGHRDLNSLLIYYNESAESIAGRVHGPNRSRQTQASLSDNARRAAGSPASRRSAP